MGISQRVLGVVAKRPAAGQTKTRLCPPLDDESAAALYTCFLRDTLDLMRRVDGVQRAIAFLPQEAEAYFRQLAPDFARLSQRGDDLGMRLHNLLTDLLEAGAQQAVVMDSDSPTLPASYLKKAFAELDRGADVVLGPCDDGGYYLIGLTRPQPRLLQEVQMSTPSVLQDTLAIAQELALKTALLPSWYDVDTPVELARLRRELSQLSSDVAPNTRHWLAAARSDGKG